MWLKSTRGRHANVMASLSRLWPQGGQQGETEPVQVKSTRGHHADVWPLRQAVHRGHCAKAMASRQAVRRDGARASKVDTRLPRQGMAFEASDFLWLPYRGYGLQAGGEERRSPCG